MNLHATAFSIGKVIRCTTFAEDSTANCRCILPYQDIAVCQTCKDFTSLHFAGSRDDEPEVIDPDPPKRRRGRLRKSAARDVLEQHEVFHDALPQQERENQQPKKRERFDEGLINKVRSRTSGVSCVLS